MGDSRLSIVASFVLLDTGGPGHPYLYGCYCRRGDGPWLRIPAPTCSGHGSSESILVSERCSSGMRHRRTPSPSVSTSAIPVIQEEITDGVYLAMRLNVPDTPRWVGDHFVFGTG
jgi:hypothetical protein